jgi:hypothetical protein
MARKREEARLPLEFTMKLAKPLASITPLAIDQNIRLYALSAKSIHKWMDQTQIQIQSIQRKRGVAVVPAAKSHLKRVAVLYTPWRLTGNQMGPLLGSK